MATKNIDLPTLIELYHDEDECRRMLEALRWPSGVSCPKCGAAPERVTPIPSRGKHRCNECQYQFSVRAGTVLQDSKLPLWKWFLATYMIVEAKKGVSSNQLKRMLGVTYKTAWFLSHRVRGAMGQITQRQLTGIVEADETFVGPKERNKMVDGQRLRGRVAGDPKTAILGAVERGGELRLRLGPRRTREALHGFLRDNIADDAEAVYTDELQMYGTAGLADEDTRHETVNHSKEEWVRGDVHTNTIEGVWSLFKRSLIGSYHHLSVKHLPAYLDELEWRYNNRNNPYLFRETMRVLVTADPLTYAELIAG